MSPLNLGEKLALDLLASNEEAWVPILMPDGSARQRQWWAEDGWLVVYTTEPVDRGRWEGRFVAMVYKPVGPGARTGKADRWERTYARAFVRRKDAKARAVALFRQHSPGWSARNPER